jgi:hypothetical protein
VRHTGGGVMLTANILKKNKQTGKQSKSRSKIVKMIRSLTILVSNITIYYKQHRLLEQAASFIIASSIVYHMQHCLLQAK